MTGTPSRSNTRPWGSVRHNRLTATQLLNLWVSSVHSQVSSRSKSCKEYTQARVKMAMPPRLYTSCSIHGTARLIAVPVKHNPDNRRRRNQQFRRLCGDSEHLHWVQGLQGHGFLVQNSWGSGCRWWRTPRPWEPAAGSKASAKQVQKRRKFSVQHTGQRETEREESDRQTDKQTNKQTDRQADRQTDRQTDMRVDNISALTGNVGGGGRPPSAILTLTGEPIMALLLPAPICEWGTEISSCERGDFTVFKC